MDFHSIFVGSCKDGLDMVDLDSVFGPFAKCLVQDSLQMVKASVTTSVGLGKYMYGCV